MILSAIRRHGGKLLEMNALSVRHNARYDARLSPAQPGDRLSPTEIKLAERHEHRLVRLDLKRAKALRNDRVKIIANELGADERSFNDLVRDSKGDIAEALLSFNSKWKEARALVARRFDELVQFKRENLLNREPEYPSMLLGIGVLVFAFVLETMANAALFAQVSRWGLSGGALNSMALSAPNITLGFAAGFWGLRGRNHVRPAVRSAATLLTILAFSAALLWNLFVAHVRMHAELVAGSKNTLVFSDWRQVGRHMLADPVAAFGSPQAMLLLFLGLIVFGILVREGLAAFGDRYPGFAAADRRLRRALAASRRCKRRFFRTLRRLQRRGTRRIQSRLKAIDAKVQAGLNILNGARAVTDRFALRAADLLWVYRAVVREYQSLNRACRGECNIPDRFDAPIDSAAALSPYDWQAMREGLRAALAAAAMAADAAAGEIDQHRLAIMREIEAQDVDPTLQKFAPVPLLSSPRETA